MRLFLLCCILLISMFIVYPIFTTTSQQPPSQKSATPLPVVHDELPAANADGWRLVWADEFNDATLNVRNWTREHAALEKNEELQFYARDHVYVKDGLLHLRSTDQTTNGQPFTSGAVHTRGKKHFLYGKVEMRAKYVNTAIGGVWPGSPNETTLFPVEFVIDYIRIYKKAEGQ